MSVGIVAMGAMFSGFLSNHIDIAPNFAGTLVALTNTAATLPGIVVPLFVGFVTHGNVRSPRKIFIYSYVSNLCIFLSISQQNIGAWRIIFGVTIALFLLEFLVFVIFGSGAEQSWNRSGQEAKDGDVKDEKTPLKETNVATKP